MKLMKRGTETEYVPDCFIDAYKTLGYSVVGEEETPPAAPPQNEQEQVVPEEEVIEPKETETPPEDPKEEPEQVVPEEKKETEFVCKVCGKSYSRKANLDRHIADKHS